MSTGDQSEYLRKKMAERRITSALGGQPAFMKSGFQRWAENERPTRVGGAEKEPLEKSRDGGRNILPEIKKLGKKMYQQFYEMEGGAHCEDESSSDEETGGRIMAEDIEQGAQLAEQAKRLQGKGYSGNGASLYQPGKTHAVKAVSKRASKMARGAGLKVDQYLGNWYVWETSDNTGEVKGKKGGPYKSKEEAKKALKEMKKEMKEQNKEVKEEAETLVDLSQDHRSREQQERDREEYERKEKERQGKGRKPTKASLQAAMGKVEQMGSGKLVIQHKDSGHGSELIMGSGREVGAGKKRSSARGELVKKIMREKGLSLPMASKYVKEHNLYKG